MSDLFGKEFTLTEEVVCTDPSMTKEQKEDLELWSHCVRQVCQGYMNHIKNNEKDQSS